MTMTTLESWRIIVENEHNDVQKILDDWENEQQAALLTEDELKQQYRDLRDALEFYANEDNWAINSDYVYDTAIKGDGGFIAKQALVKCAVCR